MEAQSRPGKHQPCRGTPDRTEHATPLASRGYTCSVRAPEARKTIQEFLRSEGGNGVSPKNCLREALKQSLIEDEDAWLSILEDSNLTSRTYDEKLAHAVYGRLPGHLGVFYGLMKTLEAR